MKFTIKEQEFDVEVISIGDIEKIKEKVLQDEINKSQEFAKNLEDKDRRVFLMDAYKSLPKGEELLERVNEFVTTVDGVTYLISLITGIEKDISVDEIEDYLPMIEFAFGVQGNENEEVEPDTSKNAPEPSLKVE